MTNAATGIDFLIKARGGLRIHIDDVVYAANTAARRGEIGAMMFLMDAYGLTADTDGLSEKAADEYTATKLVVGAMAYV